MDQTQQKNWWGRNWKWVVPVGCLGSLMLLVAFVFLIVTFVFGVIKSSDVYEDALTRAREHPAVQQALGTPIEEGFIVSGNINVSGSSGEADISIPISGPRGEATIYAVARKSAGQWTYQSLTVEIEGTAASINLLE